MMLRAETVRDDAEERARPGRIDELYRRHAPDALRLAYLLTGDRYLAEDLVQEAFVRILGRFRDLRNPDAFWWYLRKTLVNLARGHFRRRKVERAHVGPEPLDRVPGDEVEARDEVLRALRDLRPEVRAAVVLRYYEDLTEVQTADVLGCAVGTVKSMLSRARDRLRVELSER